MFFQQYYPASFVTAMSQKHFGLRVGIGELPVFIDRKEPMGGVLEDVRHRLGGFLEGTASMISFGKLTDLTFSDGKSHVEQRDVQGFGEIIVGAGRQCLLEVLSVGACGNQQDEKFVSLRPGAKFAAETDAALARKHP